MCVCVSLSLSFFLFLLSGYCLSLKETKGRNLEAGTEEEAIEELACSLWLAQLAGPSAQSLCTSHTVLGLPTLVVKQVNKPQTCSQANLTEAVPQVWYPLLL